MRLFNWMNIRSKNNTSHELKQRQQRELMFQSSFKKTIQASSRRDCSDKEPFNSTSPCLESHPSCHHQGNISINVENYKSRQTPLHPDGIHSVTVRADNGCLAVMFTAQFTPQHTAMLAWVTQTLAISVFTKCSTCTFLSGYGIAPPVLWTLFHNLFLFSVSFSLRIVAIASADNNVCLLIRWFADSNERTSLMKTTSLLLKTSKTGLYHAG